MDEFYTFRYEDIYLGTIELECDGPTTISSSKMSGILTRVIPDLRRGKKKRLKRLFHEDEIAETKSTFQQVYMRNKQNDCELSTATQIKPYDETLTHIPVQTEVPIKRKRYNMISSDEKTMTNSHKTGCFGNILRILRKKLGRRRRETGRANSDDASNDDSTSSENCEEDIPPRDESIDKCLKMMGYRYALTHPILNSCSKVTTTVHVDVTRVNRLNQGLTLLKEEELTDYDSDTMRAILNADELKKYEEEKKKKKKLEQCQRELQKRKQPISWRRQREVPTKCDEKLRSKHDSSDEEKVPKKREKISTWSSRNDERNDAEEENVPALIKMNRHIRKYYNKRYLLFEKFDDGIKLDEESWYSVTPESIARHIADRCRCDTILDGFCGVGGNAIQFAFTCKNVIAIDIDPEKIKMAEQNAAIYGLAGVIDFRVGDFFELAPKIAAERRIDVVFLSPPWGGVDYLDGGKFPLSRILPKDGKELFEFAQTISKAVSYYLPRTTNIAEVVGLCGPGEEVEIQQNLLRGRLCALTCYFDELARTDLQRRIASDKAKPVDGDATSKSKVFKYDEVILGANTDISLDDW